MSKSISVIFGAGAGGVWGAVGYLGGPVLGTITMVGSATVGAIAGYYTGPCCEDASETVRKANETIDNASKTVASANEAVNEVYKTVRGIKNITATGNGVCILAIGLSLGSAVWLMGADCNPICTDQNVEYIRLAATALATLGVAVIGISGVKSIFSS